MDIKKIFQDNPFFKMGPKSDNPKTGSSRSDSIKSTIYKISNQVIDKIKSTFGPIKHATKEKFPSKTSEYAKNTFKQDPTTGTSNVRTENFSYGSTAKLLAKEIYNKRFDLLDKAEAEANGDESKVHSLLLKAIDQELQKENISLGVLTSYPEAMEVLLGSSNFRFALTENAKSNLIKYPHDDYSANIIKQHVVYLSKLTVEDEFSLISRAYSNVPKGSPNPENDAWENLIGDIRDAFTYEGLDMNDVLKNPVARSLFQRSDILRAALSNDPLDPRRQEPLFKSRGPKPEPTRPPPWQVPPWEQEWKSNFNTGRQQKAPPWQQEWKSNFNSGWQQRSPPRGPSDWISELGLEKFRNDPKALRAEVRKLRTEVRNFLLKNHPDKNPNADLELVKKATILYKKINDILLNS